MKHTKKTVTQDMSDETEKQIKEVRREWRHLLKFTDENHLLVMAFLVVITGVLVLNAVYIIHQSKRNANPVATLIPINNSVLTSLQSGQNGALKVQISNVTENSNPDYGFPIAADETMLIMSIKITNTTTATQHLLPVNQFYVRSNEGDYAAMHASMYVTTPLPSLDLKPSQSTSGQISFNIPKRVSRPLVYVDTGWNDRAPIVFDVLH